MPETLLQTKLYMPPLRPNLVPRTQLIDRLNQGLQLGHKLTLISAPAGFGKTTVASSWATKTAKPIAWISLDKNDNNIAQFLAYLIAALQVVDSSLGQRAQAVLQSQQRLLVKPILMTLVNEIAQLSGPAPEDSGDDFILVLDDYHVIEEPSVHQAIEFLLENQLPHLHLVILTRTDPPLPLARLRARNQMVEIRSNDLEFTAKETDVFFNDIMNLFLAQEDITLLETQTEGWIAGLQLAAISLQGQTDRHEFIRAFSGNDRYVIDYLLDEVLLRQPGDVRRFLLQTAVLERMCGPLCDAVVNPAKGESLLNGQDFLEYLDQANLFMVPLDNQRKWYRYHHLFSDVLLHRLLQTELDRIPELHIRASEWYAGEAYYWEAIHHALAAEDFERVATIVEQNALRLLTYSNLASLMKWLKALPKDLIHSRPWLCVYQGWMELLVGTIEQANRWVQNAERLLVTVTQHEKLDDHEIYGHISIIRAHIALKNRELQKAEEFAHQTLDYVLERSPLHGHCAVICGLVAFWNGDLEAASQGLTEAVSISQDCGHLFMAVDATIWLGYIKTVQGHLHQAVKIYRDALRLADLGGKRILPISGCAFIGIGLVERERNNVTAAEDLLREGLDLCSLFGNPRSCHLALAQVRQAQGNLPIAFEEVQKAEWMESNPDVTFAHLRADIERVRLWLSQDGGNLPAAARWAEESGLDADDSPSFSQRIEYTTLARVLIAQDQIDKALGLLGRLRDDAYVGGRNGDLIEILALQALAYEAQGHVAQAQTILEQALTLAEQEGYVRTFVDLGDPMAHLLRKLASQSAASNYARKLIQAFEPDPHHGRSKPAQAIYEPLSARELDVLRLLKTDLTGPEIAREMVVELSTFRFHTKNIYRKLSVNSRRAAVYRADELGLL